jgi:hypothetical protein
LQRVAALMPVKLCDRYHAPAPLPQAYFHPGAVNSCAGVKMSGDAKLGVLLLFVVFALMVIGPALAG